MNWTTYQAQQKIAPKDLTQEQFTAEINYIEANKLWGPRWAEIQVEIANRYRHEMTELIGSPSANRYY